MSSAREARDRLWFRAARTAVCGTEMSGRGLGATRGRAVPGTPASGSAPASAVLLRGGLGTEPEPAMLATLAHSAMVRSMLAMAPSLAARACATRAPHNSRSSPSTSPVPASGPAVRWGWMGAGLPPVSSPPTGLRTMPCSSSTDATCWTGDATAMARMKARGSTPPAPAPLVRGGKKAPLELDVAAGGTVPGTVVGLAGASPSRGRLEAGGGELRPSLSSGWAVGRGGEAVSSPWCCLCSGVTGACSGSRPTLAMAASRAASVPANSACSAPSAPCDPGDACDRADTDESSRLVAADSCAAFRADRLATCPCSSSTSRASTPRSATRRRTPTSIAAFSAVASATALCSRLLSSSSELCTPTSDA